MHLPSVAPRVGACAGLALGLLLLAHTPASAQRRSVRPLTHSLQQPAVPLRPPGSNNQPGLASDGLLAPFGGVGNTTAFGTGGGFASSSGPLPALSGTGQAGVAGLPNGGLGNYSGLNPFNNSMTYNSMALSGAYGPFGGAYPYGGMPYGGYPYGGMPYGAYPYGGMPYGGMPFGGMPYGGMPYGGMPFGGYPPYGMTPFGGMSPYGGMMPYGGMTPFGGLNPYNGLMPSLGNFNSPQGRSNPQNGGGNPLGL
jgi:5'-3' exoribonuclease 2